MSLSMDVCLASIGIPHDGLTLREQSLGGSETAAIHVARALAQRGHRVMVFAPLPPRDGPIPRMIDGVFWFPIEQFAQFANATPHHVTIISRDVNLLRGVYNAPIKVMWCHDLAIKRLRNHVGPCLWNTDALYVLSDFQRQQYVDVYGLPLDAFLVTRNGVDTGAITQAARGITRDPTKLVYGSRPERGLDAALAIMALLAKRGSPYRLEVSGYDSPGLAPQLQQFYAGLHQRAASMPNVVVRGPLLQTQWHQQLASAQALVYPGCPGDFREISCIVAAEAQVCGTPMVALAQGAIPQTLRGAGILVGDETTDPNTLAHVTAMADALEQLRDPAVWGPLHAQGLANAPVLDWSGVAEQWEADWVARFAARRNDPERVRAGYRRTGDHEALRNLP